MTEGRACVSGYSPYNLRPVKPRTGQRTHNDAYAASSNSSQQPDVADPTNIPYPVTLVREDGDNVEWTATVDVLPGCNARGTTPDQALRRVASAVTAWVEAAEREGKDVPEPKSIQSHSGRLLLRMPQTLHAELSRAAERESVSLNQFISDALAGALGWRAPARKAAARTRAVPTETVGAREANLGDEGGMETGESQQRARLTNAVFVANAVIVAMAAIVAIVVLIAVLR